MREWTPTTLYDAKPWVLIGLGVLLGIGLFLWSLIAGSWTWWRGLGCLGGAALAIAGGATYQLRSEYRAKSKWQRETRP